MSIVKQIIAVVLTPAAMVGICLPLCPIGLGDSDQDASLRSQSYFYFMKGVLATLNNDSEEALHEYEKSAILDRNSTYVKLKQTEELLNLNRTEEAQKILSTIEKSESKNPEFFVLSARLNSQLGNLIKSMKDLDYATNFYFEQENYLKAREIALTKVALQADNRDYNGSISTLENYLKKRGDDEIAYYFLGKIHSIFHNKASAKRAFSKALSIRTGFPAAAKALGLEYELEGKLDSAFQVYQTANRSNAGDDDLIQKLINLSLMRDDYNSALEYIHQYLEIYPDDLQNLLRAGLIHYKLKQYDQAKENLKLASTKETAPLDRIYFYLGTIDLETKNMQEAVNHFKNVPSDSDYFVESRLQASTILSAHLNNVKESLELVEDSLKKKKDNADLVLARAALLDQSKQTAKAIDYLKSSQESFPQNEKLLFMLGSLQDRIGQADASIETMRQILEFNKDNPHALNHIGYSYAERGIKLEDAESLLKRAIQLAPKNGFILDSLGWTYFKMGKHKKAAEVFERANQLAPNQPIILEHLADNYYKLGQRKQALEAYQKIMKFSSDENEIAEKDLNETSSVKERVREKIALLADSSIR